MQMHVSLFVLVKQFSTGVNNVLRAQAFLILANCQKFDRMVNNVLRA